ncbi:MAG: mismatch repair protein MutT [Rhodoglobus sp.]|nr:mismatch repair protein MutT [Rhodoglobus sp.]
MDIRVAAYGVIVREGRVLLAHWNAGDHGGWTLPGGGIDPGEDPADAAVREIREETGYEASLDRLLGVDSIVIPVQDRLSQADGPLHALRIIYAATIVGGALAHEAEGSTDEARWVDLDEVALLDRVGLVDLALQLWRDAAD